MIKEYIVTFLNLDTNKVADDTFLGNTEYEARQSFRACYQHDGYKILSLIEKEK